jgi:PIN domain nuclease of toxin-antitoxin system
MSAIVADTHAALWSLREPQRLSVAATAAIQQAIAGGDVVFISAITVVEIRYLIEKASLPATDFDLLLSTIEKPDASLVVVPIDLAIGLAVEQVPRHLVPDMPDRIIAATALHLGLPLVTKDAQIRESGVPTIW